MGHPPNEILAQFLDVKAPHLSIYEVKVPWPLLVLCITYP